METSSFRVLITAAAGELAQPLVYMVANGEAFGELQPITLHLYDSPQFEEELVGLQMELLDCVFPLLQEVIVSTDIAAACAHVRYAFLIDVGGPEKTNKRRYSWDPSINFFHNFAKQLYARAHKWVKIVVMGLRPNASALLMSIVAPKIPTENITALTRLAQNRATALMAKCLGLHATVLQNVAAWGNFSLTVVPDVSYAVLPGRGKTMMGVPDVLGDYAFLKKRFVYLVQRRGLALKKKCPRPAGMSLARAACQHTYDWWHGVPEEQFVSMGVMSDGSYGIPEGLIYSFPVAIDPKKGWSIMKDLKRNSRNQIKIEKTTEELMREKLELCRIMKPDAVEEIKRWLKSCQRCVAAREDAKLRKQRRLKKQREAEKEQKKKTNVYSQGAIV